MTICLLFWKKQIINFVENETLYKLHDYVNERKKLTLFFLALTKLLEKKLLKNKPILSKKIFVYLKKNNKATLKFKVKNSNEVWCPVMLFLFFYCCVMFCKILLLLFSIIVHVNK